MTDRARELAATLRCIMVPGQDTRQRQENEIAAAFAEVKRVTRDSILREAANVADTSTFKNRGDAIRALIDTPTEPAAPDPTKALVEVLREIESFLSDPRIGTVNYMESQRFYTDCDAALDKVRAALRLAEDGR